MLTSSEMISLRGSDGVHLLLHSIAVANGNGIIVEVSWSTVTEKECQGHLACGNQHRWSLFRRKCREVEF